ncbi:MAG: histidine kinase, partial [Phaeodactylibacter sp.]|nr:histidine kinase [Phaeodactylibacter sp.]
MKLTDSLHCLTLTTALALSLLIVPGAGAQQPHPFFRQYTADDGLPSDVVYNIIEDRQGYIWFSTGNGLCRFNGYEVEQFPSPQKDLNYTALFNMRLDSLGRVWSHSIYGKLYYFDQDSIFKHPYSDTVVLSNKPHFQFSLGFAVEGGGEQAIYFLDGLGIIRVESGGRQELIRPQVLPALMAMEQDGIFTTANAWPTEPAIRRARLDSLRQTGLRPPLALCRGDSITVIGGFKQASTAKLRREFMIRYADGMLVFRNGDLYYLQGDRIQWHQVYPHNPILFRQDREGRLMAGLNGRGGVLFYDNLEALQQGRFRRYLEGYSVTAMCQDSRGGYWFTTLGDGVFYTPGFGLEIYDERSGLPQESARALALKSEEEAFIGFDNGSAYFLGAASDTLAYLGTPSPGKDLFALEYDAVRGQLWAATGRLFKYETGEWIPYEERYINPWQPYSIIPKNIVFSPDGRALWINGAAGFAAIGPESGQLLIHSSAFNDQQRTYSIFQDSRQRVWAGVNNQMFELVDGQLETRHDWHEGFLYPVQDIAQLPDSTLVFAPNAMGLLLMDKRDSIRQLTTADGLASDAIRSLYADPQGRIWAGSSRGLSRLTPQGGGGFAIETIARANGLPSNVINKVAGAGNSVWLATDKGVVRLRNNTNSVAAPPPLLTKATANNERWDWRQKATFNHRQNNIGFEFLSLQYHFFGRIPYRYRLKRDAAWTHTFNRDVFLPALQPGRYRLEVQAKGQDGRWSPSAEAAFEVRPPYWATWWFRGLALVLAGSAFFAFFRIRTNQLKAETLRLQERTKLEKEMAELEQSALRAQMNPHFIFNCLSSIQHFILEGDKGPAVQYLSSFAQLIRATLHASMEAEVPLEDEVQMLKHYLELEQMRFRNKFDFAIEVDEQIDTYEAVVPPLLIQPYVENAIIHGLANTERGGSINIRFARAEGNIQVSVRPCQKS